MEISQGPKPMPAQQPASTPALLPSAIRQQTAAAPLELPSQAVTATQGSQDNSSVSKDQLKSAVDLVKDFIKPMSAKLDFSIDDDTGKTIVKVIDSDTKEVLRQIPSKEMLEIAKALDNLKGLFVRQTA